MNSKPNIQHSTPDDPPGRIVAAARGCFQRFGYAKTSMQEIAAACQMSAANLYRFYNGKLAIAAAVVAADQRALLTVCDRAVAAAPGDVAERLVALFLANIDATRGRIKNAPLLFDLGLRVAREQREVRRQFLDEVEARIIAILSSSRKDRAVDLDAARATGRLILIASAPFVLPWMMLNEPFGNPRAQVEPLIHALVSGLALGESAAAVKRGPRFG